MTDDERSKLQPNRGIELINQAFQSRFDLQLMKLSAAASILAEFATEHKDDVEKIGAVQVFRVAETAIRKLKSLSDEVIHRL